MTPADLKTSIILSTTFRTSGFLITYIQRKKLVWYHQEQESFNLEAQSLLQSVYKKNLWIYVCYYSLQRHDLFNQTSFWHVKTSQSTVFFLTHCIPAIFLPSHCLLSKILFHSLAHLLRGCNITRFLCNCLHSCTFSRLLCFVQVILCNSLPQLLRTCNIASFPS